MDKKVLITGVSGYLGSWCAHVALEAGYDVVGTVRDPASSKCAFLRDAIEGKPGKMSAKAPGHLTLVKGDLLSGDDAWDQIFAVQGVGFVLHTASPYFQQAPKDPGDYIRPAVEGTTSVVRAAMKHGVKRCVVTSSVGAMFHPLKDGKEYSAQDWSDISPEGGSNAYVQSKTMAEQAAWKLVEGTALEMCTVQPMFISGPTLYTSKDLISSFESGLLGTQIMAGKFPMIPRIMNSISDVRDVAKVHVLALESAQAPGKRLIAANQTRPFKEIVGFFSIHRPELEIPVKDMPNLLVHVGAALGVPALKTAQRWLGYHWTVDEVATRTALGISWTPEAQTAADMVDDFISLGAVPARKPAAPRWRAPLLLLMLVILTSVGIAMSRL